MFRLKIVTDQVRFRNVHQIDEIQFKFHETNLKKKINCSLSKKS